MPTVINEQGLVVREETDELPCGSLPIFQAAEDAMEEDDGMLFFVGLVSVGEKFVAQAGGEAEGVGEADHLFIHVCAVFRMWGGLCGGRVR